MEAQIDRNVRLEIDKMVNEMEGDALACLTSFGSAHTRANQENDAASMRQAALMNVRQKAACRGKEALRDLQNQKQEEATEKTKAITARRMALETEAVRSSYIVSLPPVHVIDKSKPAGKEEPKVMLFDKRSLFQTEYTIKEKIVEPVTSPKVSIYFKKLSF